MPYQYDVFFSYKRDPESDEWHRSVMEKLRFWLKQYLQKQQVAVFFDKEDIRTGLRWQAKLAQALTTSRAIVCVWSPLYFQSKWCVSEWRTFSAREDEFKRDLVLPANFIDGECFPPEAKAKQSADFSDYTSTLPGFWESQLAVKFENACLKPFASDLASLIKQAPAFNEKFPLIEALDGEVQQEANIERIANV